MRHIINLSNTWHFSNDFTENSDIKYIKQGFEEVNLPHNSTDIPYNYFDEKEFQKTTVYFRKILLNDADKFKTVFIDFEGVMSYARVYLNGNLLAEHKGGYTPFSVRIDEAYDFGTEDNILAVVADASERPEIPPFGGQIDYLTYSGIYREVYLRKCDPVFIDAVKIECINPKEDVNSFLVKVRIGNVRKLQGDSALNFAIKDKSGREFFTGKYDFRLNTSDGFYEFKIENVAGLEKWDIENPNLYRLEASLEFETYTDMVTESFGVRFAEFTAQGFFLNGRKIKLLGLNRHQSFPYKGYAMPKRAQSRDAEILKNELHVNTVRTSHYPQSVHFLNRCDELGLLVMEEIPGWQHIGGAEWKETAKRNVTEMIERDWNHPSIILWGVRINESPDDDELYAETNRIARDLDPSRQTGGVRAQKRGNFQEDVYTYNDFRNSSVEEALTAPREITGLGRDVPYLVTEYNGHMFPTKRFDNEERVCEHVMRHVRVVDRMYGNDGISGVIGWCAFDYNTHKDFGAGDRICHHGVMNMFRRPKFAASVYSSQADPVAETVLEPVTYWARGERSIGGILPLIILTNCDWVELTFGGMKLGKKFMPDKESFPNMPHPPVIITEKDLSGGEHGTWGMQWMDGEITGFINGSETVTRNLCCDPVPERMIIETDDTLLSSETKDVTRITVRITDRFGNPLWFLNDIVKVEIDGPAEVQGPSEIVTICGEAVFWIETKNVPGLVSVTAANSRAGSANINITVK